MPTFREIHRLRSFAHTLREQVDRIPRQMKVHQTKLAKQEQALRETQEAIRKAKVAASDNEKSLKARHGQIERYEQQINQVGSKKEYDALLLEIAHAKTVCSQLEDQILQTLADIDEKTAQLPDLEKAVAQAKEQLAAFEAEVQGRRADLEAQLTQALQDLKAVEVKVPPELLPQYSRTIASLDHDGLAVVKDRACTSCYTELTRQALGALEKEEFVVCKSCGRILYLPESSGSDADED